MASGLLPRVRLSINACFGAASPFLGELSKVRI